MPITGYYNKGFGIRFVTFLILFLTTILIISSPLVSYASQSGIDFYSSQSPPAGMNSLEPLIAKWWNWRISQPSAISTNWPQCLKHNAELPSSNESIVFFGDPASAVESNVNATKQKCEISSTQPVYLTIYAGSCSTGSKPHEGEYPDMKSPTDRLNCAQDSNKVIRLMQVKVDGTDVSSNIISQTTSQPFSLTVPPDNAFDWKAPIVGGNNTSMAENYYLFFKPLPLGDHTIQLEVIRQPLQANQPTEHDVVNWDLKVIP
jgi:hypothetical protein